MCSQCFYISLGGGPFRLNGGITTISFLDYTGALIVPPSEPWRDEGKERRDSKFFYAIGLP